MKKSVLLVGLGRYGHHVAEQLHAMKHDILAIDCVEEEVNRALPYVTHAIIGDSTDPAFLRTLGVRDFDLCIVAIGDDFQSSLETTSLLKEMGAKYVVARASRGIHEKFLLRNGADEAVYPERQLAEWTAIRYGYDHLLDYFQLSEKYAVYEIPVPEEWVGKTVAELKIRQHYHVNVLGVKKAGALHVDILPDTIFREEDSVLVVGHQDEVRKKFHL